MQLNSFHYLNLENQQCFSTVKIKSKKIQVFLGLKHKSYNKVLHKYLKKKP